MDEHPNESPEERKRRQLAELDALAREQDERAYLRDVEIAVTALLERLGARLRRLGILTEANEPGKAHVKVLPGGPEVVVGIEVDGLLYAESFGEIVVRRKQGGRHQYAETDEHGEPGEWMDVPPTPAEAASN